LGKRTADVETPLALELGKVLLALGSEQRERKREEKFICGGRS